MRGARTGGRMNQCNIEQASVQQGAALKLDVVTGDRKILLANPKTVYNTI